MIREAIASLELPTLEGFHFRYFKGESDYPDVVRITAAVSEADQLEHVETIEHLQIYYAHLTHCDPYRDMLFVENSEGKVVAYGRIWWMDEANGVRRYSFFARVHPQWRHKGIGRTMLRWFEARGREIEAAHAHPEGNPVHLVQFEVWAWDTQHGNHALYKQEGYAPVRYGYEMTRSLKDGVPIPDFSLPEGFEVRPVRPEHYRAIWEADIEANREHWGFSEPTEGQYESWLNNPIEFQPHLFKIAWDVEKDEVAGMVQNFVNYEENRAMNRERGYTENISVRKPYRRRGLARALICLSLRMLKDTGMTEAALGVDAQNPTGALRVYEACGFKPVKAETEYRKPMWARD